jgi:hypothetical protein
MGLINTTLLRLLLFTLGQGLALTSRASPSVRSQITRTLTFEISTDDGVARHWHFNGQQWRIATGAGHSRAKAQALRFPSSGQALRVLLSPRCIGRVVDGMQDGTIRLEGSLLAFCASRTARMTKWLALPPEGRSCRQESLSSPLHKEGSEHLPHERTAYATH